MAFRGTYEHSVDDRGRVALPARYRHVFTDGVKLTFCPDGCIEVFTTEEFEKNEARIAQEPASHRRGRRLRRGFSVRAYDSELDRQGRILIPQYLRERAGIGSGPVVITGRVECLEIWNTERWEEELSHVEADYGNELEALE
jgi:MraZ protein